MEDEADAGAASDPPQPRLHLAVQGAPRRSSSLGLFGPGGGWGLVAEPLDQCGDGDGGSGSEDRQGVQIDGVRPLGLERQVCEADGLEGREAEVQPSLEVGLVPVHPQLVVHKVQDVVVRVMTQTLLQQKKQSSSCFSPYWSIIFENPNN